MKKSLSSISFMDNSQVSMNQLINKDYLALWERYQCLCIDETIQFLENFDTRDSTEHFDFIRNINKQYRTVTEETEKIELLNSVYNALKEIKNKKLFTSHNKNQKKENYLSISDFLLSLHLAPIQYGEFKPNSLTYIGINPSFSLDNFKKLANYKEEKTNVWDDVLYRKGDQPIENKVLTSNHE